MKMKEMQKVRPEHEQEVKRLNAAFNATMLTTMVGQTQFVTQIMDRVKWLFIMPAEYVEQLILNVEQQKYKDPEEENAKNKILNLLRALVPVKKHLDEALADIDL